MTRGAAAVALIAGFAAATGGGAFFSWLGVPLGWLLGAMAGGALTCNLGRAAPRTRAIRRAGQVLIGTATAAALTREMLEVIWQLMPWMLGYAVFANFAGFLLSWPLGRFAGLDRSTAVLASLPAGMSEMASLATEVGGRVDAVTVVHTLRVLLVVTSMPFLFGLTAGTSALPASNGGSLAALLLCAGGGVALAVSVTRLGLLNGFVVAPMGFGALLVLFGLPIATMPPALIVAAQVLIGYSLGTRLRARLFLQLPRIALVGILCSVVLVGLTVGIAAPVIAAGSGIGRLTVSLGTAPGGLGEMIAIAKSSGVAVGLVAGFQFVRSFLTNLLVPPFLLQHFRNTKG